jgi:hypothetical protein
MRITVAKGVHEPVNHGWNLNLKTRSITGCNSFSAGCGFDFRKRPRALLSAAFDLCARRQMLRML